MAMKNYQTKKCLTCHIEFQPTGPRQKRCEQHLSKLPTSRKEKKQSKQAEREQKQTERDGRELYQKLNLCYFGEQAPGVDAKTAEAEIQIHREFLRAMDEPDVQPGETLRQLAERTW